MRLVPVLTAVACRSTSSDRGNANLLYIKLPAHEA